MKALLPLLLLFLVACDDYFNAPPDSTVGTRIDTPDKVGELLAAAYPRASYFPFLEGRTDNVEERAYGQHTRLMEAMFLWQDDDQDELDTPLNYWRACYHGIAQANRALVELAAMEKNERTRALYGEAFLLRAYLHFMLAQIWCAPYSEGNYELPGIPYVERPEINALPTYSRGTLRDTYAKIERDLQRGLSLVDDAYYRAPRFHFTQRAAYAFASRFYLITAQWDKVVAYADYVLGDDARRQLRAWDKYYATYRFNRPAAFATYLAPTEAANLLLTTTESRYRRMLLTASHGLTARLVQSIYHNRDIEGDADLGTFALTQVYPMASTETPMSEGRYLAKFDEMTTLTETSQTLPRGLYVSNVLFSADEVFLNRLEAYAMLSRYDECIADIKLYYRAKFGIDREIDPSRFLISSREGYQLLSPSYGLNRAQLALVTTILHLRRKEFMHEGLRWFDIRRHNIPVSRTTRAAGYRPLERDDLRKTLQIPNEAIKRGLPPNQRVEPIVVR